MESFKDANEQINNRLSINTKDVIQNCLECYRITTSCMQHCLALGGSHASPAHINLLTECGDICQLMASFLIKASDFAHDLGSVCAKICDACADDCNELDPEDPHLVDCMVVCRKCADSCRHLEH